jgi:hypothetical protein
VRYIIKNGRTIFVSKTEQVGTWNPVILPQHIGKRQLKRNEKNDKLKNKSKIHIALLFKTKNYESLYNFERLDLVFQISLRIVFFSLASCLFESSNPC